MNLDSFTRAKRNSRHPKRLWYRPLGRLTSGDADQLEEIPERLLIADNATQAGREIQLAEVPSHDRPLDTTLAL